MTRFRWIPVLACLALANCAAPPLTRYTLAGTPAGGSGFGPLGKNPLVIVVGRVSVPDELDSADIVVRDGSTLRRSQSGRWTSRLSLGITDRITERLAARYPGMLVTDRPLSEAAADRVLINIGRLDVTTAGATSLEADWLVVPSGAGGRVTRARAAFHMTGPVATDLDVVTLVGLLVDRLAAVIVIPPAR